MESLDDMPYEEAMKAVTEELGIRRRDVLLGQANQVYENLIKISKAEKKCQACSRAMNDREITMMEKTVSVVSPRALRIELTTRSSSKLSSKLAKISMS